MCVGTAAVLQDGQNNNGAQYLDFVAMICFQGTWNLV
jgi:hypothetical protein